MRLARHDEIVGAMGVAVRQGSASGDSRLAFGYEPNRREIFFNH